jgi:hypothetical protein
VSELALITLVFIVAVAALTVGSALLAFATHVWFGSNLTHRQQAMADMFMTGYALGMKVFTGPMKLFRGEGSPPLTIPTAPPMAPGDPQALPGTETKQIDGPVKVAN